MIQEASGVLHRGAGFLPVRVDPEIVTLALKQILLIPDEFYFDPKVLQGRIKILKAQLSLLRHEAVLHLYFRKIRNIESVVFNQPLFKKDDDFFKLDVDKKLNYLAERLGGKPREELKLYLEAFDTLFLQAKL